MDKENIDITVKSDNGNECLIKIKFNEDGDELMDLNVEFKPEGIKTDDRSFYSSIVGIILGILTDTN